MSRPHPWAAQVAAYTTLVLRARAAYRADQHVAAGYCAVTGCPRRHSGNGSRRCSPCARNRKEAP